MLTIGRIAKAAQLPVDTIRYYESLGLLPPAHRSPANYRLYPHTEIRRLQLIKQAKLLGLSLPQVKELVDQTFTDSCAHLQEAMLRRIPKQVADIDQRIAALQALKRDLLALQDRLHRLDGSATGEPVAECHDCPCVANMERR